MFDVIFQYVIDNPIQAVSAVFLFAFALGAAGNIVNYIKRIWRDG